MTFQELEDKQDTDKEESSLTDHSPTYDYTIKENDVEVKLEEIHDYNEINLQKDDSLLTSIPQIADNLNVNQVIVKQEKDAEWEDLVKVLQLQPPIRTKVNKISKIN